MTARLLAVVVAVGLFVLAVFATRGHGEPPARDDGHRRVIGHGQILFDDGGPELWAARWRREHRAAAELRRQLRRERRVLLASPHVAEAINLAAATYGHGRALWRRARCETGGTYSPRAYNGASGAAGLFQFVASTWRTTPYAGFDVFSPYANALAAGWMHDVGRGGEWSCR